MADKNIFAGLTDGQLINARQAARKAGERALATAITKELSERRTNKQIAEGQSLLAQLLKTDKKS